MSVRLKVIATVLLLAAAGGAGQWWVAAHRDAEPALLPAQLCGAGAAPDAAACTPGAPGRSSTRPLGPLGITVAASSAAVFLILAALTGGDQSQRRVMLGGWLLATGALLVAAAAGERWLRAQDLARALRGTLDDPDRRERYFEDRAVIRFNASPVETFTLRPAARLGSDTGPIVILEFTDYLCPFCRQLAGYFEEYLPRMRGRVSVYLMNSPLDQSCNTHIAGNFHPGACWMAYAAVCAERAGRITEFYREAFAAALDSAGPAEALRVGMRAGLAPATLERCLRASETRAAVIADLDEADRTHAQGTPTLFVNGRKVPLWTYLDRMVEVEAAR